MIGLFETKGKAHKHFTDSLNPILGLSQLFSFNEIQRFSWLSDIIMHYWLLSIMQSQWQSSFWTRIFGLKVHTLCIVAACLFIHYSLIKLEFLVSSNVSEIVPGELIEFLQAYSYPMRWITGWKLSTFYIWKSCNANRVTVGQLWV